MFAPRGLTTQGITGFCSARLLAGCVAGWLKMASSQAQDEPLWPAFQPKKIIVFLRNGLTVVERLWLFWVWLALGDGFFGVRVGGVAGHARVELNLQSHVSLGSSAGCAKHLQ